MACSFFLQWHEEQNPSNMGVGNGTVTGTCDVVTSTAVVVGLDQLILITSLGIAVIVALLAALFVAKLWK